MQSTEATSKRRQGQYQEMDSKGQKKLYQEEDIAKLAVLKFGDNTSVARKYAMCVAAASVAEFATYPLDLTKTRWVIHWCFVVAVTLDTGLFQITNSR